MKHKTVVETVDTKEASHRYAVLHQVFPITEAIFESLALSVAFFAHKKCPTANCTAAAIRATSIVDTTSEDLSCHMD